MTTYSENRIYFTVVHHQTWANPPSLASQQAFKVNMLIDVMWLQKINQCISKHQEIWEIPI